MTLASPFNFQSDLFRPVRLNERQKDLLRKLVSYLSEGKLKEPFVPFPLGNPTTHYVLHIRQEKSFKFKHISDLDVLCDADYLSYKWHRLGSTKLFSITKAGYDAVKNGFQTPNGGSSILLNDLLVTMSGGAFEVPKFDGHLDIMQVALDPVLRHTAVSTLIHALQNHVRNQLPWDVYRTYHERCQQLEAEIMRPHPNESRVQTLASDLSFTGDIKAPLPVTVQVWTFLYPLLIISSIRTQQSYLPK